MYYEILKKAGIKFSDTPVTGSSYIMNDGKFLDIINSMDIMFKNTSMKPTHGSLDMYLIENGYVDSNKDISRVLCSTDNAIRINDGNNFYHEIIIGLPVNKPNEIQFKKLEDWLYFIFGKGHVTVGDENTSNVYKVYSFDEYLPEDIIKRIKSYYSSGILRDSKAIIKDENK